MTRFQKIRLFCLFILCSIFSIRLSGSKNCSFQFGGVGIISDPGFSRPIVAAWSLAVREHNDGTLYNQAYMASHIQLISNGTCPISLSLHDSKFGTSFNNAIKNSITQMFNITQLYSTTDRLINVPIMLGPMWSAMAIPGNSLIDSFNMMQISAAATSPLLTQYDSFFRTIPTDSVKAKALILLCQHFNWDTVGIIYINDDYGSIFRSEMVAFSEQYNIVTQSFGFIRGDNITMNAALSQAKISGLYIFILIVSAVDVGNFVDAVERYDMMSHPYYYVGTAAVFSGSFDLEALHIFGGVIGICPWSPSIDDVFEEQYPYPLNISSQMYKMYYSRWTNPTAESRSLFYNVSEPDLYSAYAYDAALAVIKAIDKYIELNDIENIQQFGDMIDADISTFGTEFKNVLKNIWFIGLSGNVSFYENGDRKGGLNAYCNIDPVTGLLNKIGFSIDGALNNELILNQNAIKWPLAFEDKGTIPFTQYIEYPGMATFSSLPIIIWCLTFFCILIAIFYIICLIYYRNLKIIRASQWQFSVIMLLGVIIADVTLIIYGIDESFPYDDKYLQNPWNWSILCNVRLILLNTAFSFVFAPLLCKVYRVKRVFNLKFQFVELSTVKMVFYMLLYILIDLIILIIIIAIIPTDRIYIKSTEYDDSNFMQYYGSCSSDYAVVYYIFVCIPKLIATVYCVIISIAAYSQVSIMKYNEGLQIIFAVLLSTLLTVIAVSLLFSVHVNNHSSAVFFYGFLALMLLMICNFVISIMLLPRLVIIWRGMEHVYEEDSYKQMEKIQFFMNNMRQQLNKCESTSQGSQPTTTTKTDVAANTNSDVDIEVNMYKVTQKQNQIKI